MKILASDYDGTIKVDGIVSKRNIEMILKWKEKGNQFGFITGRSSESMLEEIKTYQFPYDFIICNNGGIIYNKQLELIKKYEIDFDIALKLIDEIRKMKCNCFVLNNGFHRAKEVVSTIEEDYKYGKYSMDYSIERIIEEKVICQIVISINDKKEAQRICEDLNYRYKNYICAYPNTNCIDIVPNNVSKKSGLDFIKEYYHYEEQDIYCIGDALNDLPMLENYNSATLCHGFNEVKEVIPLHFDEVASYLEMLMK